MRLVSFENYADKRGCATESHWDEFVTQTGGIRLTSLHPNPRFPNADYLFENEKVVIELKNIQTEFGETPKFERAHKEFCENFLLYGERGIPTLASYRRITRLMQRPLAALAKKANSQIKQTKKELGLGDWSGLLVCVNDNFRRATPRMVEGVLARSLHGSMSSIEGAVYLTNHFVEFPNIPYACLVWSPFYSENCRDDLPDFVNWLGARWHEYSESVLGEFQHHLESDELTLRNALPVAGPYRQIPDSKSIYLPSINKPASSA